MPISTYPAMALTGAKVIEIVRDPRAQVEAQQALRERYASPFLLSAMDLSAEAEAFGCSISFSDSEVPTVTGRLVTSAEQAQRLVVPGPGAGRTGVFLETVRDLRHMDPHAFVFGGCIGPFSLAARLVGVSESMELTMTEPALMHTLLDKSSEFLLGYIQGFRAAGASGVIMAEPAAGLLSPRAMAAFSSAYIRRIAGEVNGEGFTLLLHNCAAKLVHLPAIRETGLNAFHFGAPMDVVSALGQVPQDVVLCGNLDPAGLFVQSAPDAVYARTAGLLRETSEHRNFVVSSGCDLPPNATLPALDAFYAAAKEAPVVLNPRV